MTTAICQRMDGDRALLTIQDEYMTSIKVFDTVFKAADWCRQNKVDMLFKCKRTMHYRTIFEGGEYILIDAESDDDAIESALFYADMLHREVADIEPEH